jgi:signal transduction histidine kinase/ligand-binding sensor domain-containing protein
VTTLAEGQDESIWCGTRQGLYRLDRTGSLEKVDAGLPAGHSMIGAIRSLVIDRNGSAWIGTGESGLFRRQSNGTVDRFGGAALIYALMMDRRGRIWAAIGAGIYVFEPTAGGGSFPVYRVFNQRHGLPNARMRDLLEAQDGSIWAASENGISVLPPDGQSFRSYGARNGLSDVQLRALGEDVEGNVWMAAESCLMRLTRSGMVTYDATDGLGGNSFVSAFAGRDGNLYFVNGIRDILINRFDSKRFRSVRPLTRLAGKAITYMGWGIGQTVLQDHAGEWWIPTGEGLCRFSGIRSIEDLERTPPSAVYTTRDGLPGNDIFHLFEDRKGDLWISTVDTPGLTRWDRESGRFYQIRENDGFVTPNPPAAFAEDSKGDLWVGMLWSGLARLRGGVWTMFTAREGVPDGSLWSIIADRRGRLWIASSREGVARIDDPTSDRPRFALYSTKRGLSSDLIKSLVEDQSGTIYIAGARGIDALDPETNFVRHFTAADGLASGDVSAALCDRSGNLWFGATTGLSRLVRGKPRKASSPPIRITRLRIAGVNRSLSGLGEEAISELQLPSDSNHIDIDFVSPAFRAGATPSYQYRLGGHSDWSEAAESRSVSLVGLKPGRYQFEVRAISDGIPSVHSATVLFHVLPTFWRTGWALAGESILVALVIYAIHHYRLARLLELERVRTRIATDLHDDIGSTLSQITVLSEVIRQQVGHDAGLSEPLSTISSLSRDLIDSLSDIVWAINPLRDSFGDLTQRMRQFANDLFAGRPVELQFQASLAQNDLKMGVDTRREVFLIFKEGLNNISRHSNCRRIDVEFAANDGKLQMTLTDDGQGFDCAAVLNGNGLSNMRQRAARLGGTLTVTSDRKEGTVIRLMAPVRSRSMKWPT